VSAASGPGTEASAAQAAGETGNAATPGQAALVPDMFARYMRSGRYPERSDAELAIWWNDLSPSEREFWTGTAREPQPAPGLRADLEAALADWREDALYHPADTRDEIIDHRAVAACADTLAGILAQHPEPKPAPEQYPVMHQLSGLVAGWRQAVREHDDAWRTSGADADHAVAKTLREVDRQVGELLPGLTALAEEAYAAREAQPAPGLAAAMARVRRALEDSPTASIARREALEIINAFGVER